MLLGDRPADLKGRQGSLSAQILRALFVYDDKPCLKTVGYFQEAVLFQDHLSKLRGWFRPDLVPPPPAPAFPELDETSVLVHIRSCNCGFYFLPFEWFDFVLTHMQKRGPPTKSGQQAQPGNSSTSTIASTTPMKVYLVLTPTCRNSDLVKALEKKWNATYLRYSAVASRQATGGNSKSNPTTASVALDFRAMLNAPRLLLGKSTFGFWAGFLSVTASEVHMPMEKKKSLPLPLPYNDPRFIFHRSDILDKACKVKESGEWFGTFQANAMRFEFREELGKRAQPTNNTQ